MQEMKLSRQQLNIVLIIIFISMTGIFISDIFIPSMPSIVADLKTSKPSLEFSVPFYFLLFALGQLFFGPLSEKFGRRFIVLCGLYIALVGSLITIFSFSVQQLFIGRAIEAIGMAAPLSISRAILRDIIKNNTLYVTVNSYMGSMILIAPVIAPLFGAYLAIHFGWRSNFGFLIVLNILGLLLAHFVLTETLLTRKKRISAKLTYHTYINILKKPFFSLNVFISALFMASVLSYLALSSFLFQKTLGLSITQFSWTFAIGDAFIILGMLANPRILKHYNLDVNIGVGIFFGLLAALTMGLLILFGWVNAITILCSVMFFNFAAGIVFPSCGAYAILPFTRRLGAVGALMGALQMLTAGLLSSIITQVPLPAVELLAIIFTISSVMGLTAYLGLIKLKNKTK
ncbi:multidrug effflux MFS transporter [Thiotrichales bacterium 19S9-12]|nr:multidrug effflux MFS transporter [Thiotrichales bacterium 19S9-11]MCF6811780.1 multidrug effflux MFS transporter [Thiotrichales bacterium 19S9-12]